MGFAPIYGRFCSIFLHLVQEPTPNFGEFRNKFCNIFVTILPHLFRFGETSFYGGKKCRFSSFSGRGGGLFRRVLGSPTRGAVEPKARLRGCMGESPARETAAFGFGTQRFYLRRSSFFVQPLRHPFGMPPPLVGEALAGHRVLGRHFIAVCVFNAQATAANCISQRCCFDVARIS